VLQTQVPDQLPTEANAKARSINWPLDKGVMQQEETG